MKATQRWWTAADDGSDAIEEQNAIEGRGTMTAGRP
jgi:hypothetical protein